MVQILPPREPKQPTFLENVLGGLAEGLPKAAQLYTQLEGKKEQKEALIKAGFPEAIGLAPELQKAYITESLKGKRKTSEEAEKLKGNQAILKDIETRRNLPEGSLSAYEKNPAMAEAITRPAKEPKKTQASQPIDPEQLSKIKEIRKTPEYKKASPLGKYQILTDAGVSKENAVAESDIAAKESDILQKSFETAYKENKDFIDDTTASYRGFETEMKPRLLQMQKIPAEDLIKPTAAAFLDLLKIPLGALEDPSSELYQKLSQDLLKGLPETYGNRILKVEVDNFLKTIPTLLNSPDGRRMIASNMLKLGEMKKVYYNEMRKQQQEYLDQGKFPRDFQQRVFDQVQPQINRINQEFVKLSEIKSLPDNHIPFFNPSGDIEFVPKELEDWAISHGGKKIW